MKHFGMRKFWLLTAVLAVLLAACSDDDDMPEPEPEAFVRFNASGMLSGTFEGGGGAGFEEGDEGKSLVLRFTDGNSFLLEFVKGPEDDFPDMPAEGSYSLGGLGSDADFFAVLTDPAQGTAFLGNTDGTLVVSSSGNAFAEGTFEFTTSALTNPDAAVEVTGGVYRIAVPE